MVMKNASSTIKHAIVDFAINIKNIGVADPRRITHSLKVALAITMVSMIYFLQLFYNNMGDAGIWAILTVVLVFEFGVGATLSKSLNRGFATLVAGVLGVAVDSFASIFGSTSRPVILGFFLFLIVALATFTRFVPNIKKRYDYGALIFILTFAMVSVSGYRVDKIIKFAHQRLTTILFAATTCVLISIFVCPVWAGEDLHNLIVNNLEKLASFLEGFGDEYYRISNGNKSCIAAYKSVLNSKGTEESLANFAWWEIGHGRFRFRHPWKKYIEIGVYTRQCASHVEALNGYLKAKDEAPSEFQNIIKEPCIKMSSELGKALNELGLSMKLMIYPSSSTLHIENCKNAVDELKTTLKVTMIAECDILEAIPVIAATSILVEIIKCVEAISEAIKELSKQAHFKNPTDITPDKAEEHNFLNCGSHLKVAGAGEDEESIIVSVLSDDKIPQELDLGKSKREIN
ncbi:aluminum-activated malate transporter 8-like [Bidens hawaiensis]|uniref:aluminum-activated malate transporter 8-like n=1 Tax=Bidens hawaiensis TaxID=980011 RepID=UPI004049A9AA